MLDLVLAPLGVDLHLVVFFPVTVVVLGIWPCVETGSLGLIHFLG